MTTKTKSFRLGQKLRGIMPGRKSADGDRPMGDDEFAGLTEEEKATFLSDLMEKLQNSPPTIGLIGVSGVAKSSTINTMFKANLAVSHTRACTQEFGDVRLTGTGGTLTGQDVSLVVRDAPGLGEDVRRDPEFIQMYEKELPACDVVLWVLSARNRAVALDQMYLEHFVKRARQNEALADLPKKLVFGVNQVDMVHTMNWPQDEETGEFLPIPSVEQAELIRDIVADRSERISEVLGREIEVVPYSNVRGFNLERLFAEMLASAREGRAWIFNNLRDFSLTDFVPAAHRKHTMGKGEKCQAT